MDVVVIGGGQAGLATAWHLARHHLRFLVLDAAPELGGTLALPVGLPDAVHPHPGRRPARHARPRAAGYRSDYSWIHVLGVSHDGTIIHRRGVTDVPGLYFVGLPWQHTRGSALLGFVNDDAAFLAGRIVAHQQTDHVDA